MEEKALEARAISGETQHNHDGGREVATIRDEVRDLRDDGRILRERLAALEAVVWKLAGQLHRVLDDHSFRQ